MSNLHTKNTAFAIVSTYFVGYGLSSRITLSGVSSIGEWAWNIAAFMVCVSVVAWIWHMTNGHIKVKTLAYELREFLDLHSNYLTDDTKQEMIDEYLQHRKEANDDIY